MTYIYLNGGELHKISPQDSYNPLADYFGLSEEDRVKTRDEMFGDGDNQKAWNNRVQWARKSLNDYGYLESNTPRGVWKLSEAGVIAARNLASNYIFFNPAPEETSVSVDIEPPERVETTVYRILRDTPLARQLKELHKNKCQICTVTIKISDSKNYSEAHHIKPLGGIHKGLDVKENIIVLCPAHHVQCDYGAVKLDVNNIRTAPGHKISLEFIDYHNSCVFQKIV